MNLEAFFLNHRIFTTKKGDTYQILTCCAVDGAVIEFWHDKSIDVPNYRLFTPLNLHVLPEIKSKGNIGLKLLSIEPIKRKDE